MRAAKKISYGNLSTDDLNYRVVLAELVTYIEDTFEDSDNSPVFKMADLTNISFTQRK